MSDAYVEGTDQTGRSGDGDVPAAGCVEARRDARRGELINGAIRVIRRAGPGASMEQIAAEAGVSKPILYRYFKDRADLVAAVADRTLEDVNATLARVASAEGSVHSVMASLIDAFLDLIERDAEVYRFLVHRTVADGLDEQMALSGYIRRTGQQVAAVIEARLRAAGLDTGPSATWGIGITGMVHAAASWWLEGSPLSRERLRTYLCDLVVHGLPFTDESPRPDGADRVVTLRTSAGRRVATSNGAPGRAWNNGHPHR